MSIQEIINQIIEEEGKLQARIDSSPTSVSPNYRFSIYYQNLGDALLKLNRNHEAFQAYSRAAELQENYNKDGAIACYQKLISLNSNYIAAYEKLTQLQSSNWKKWLILSQKLEQKGETEKAIASYQEVLKLNTDYIEVYEKLTHLQPNNWKHWFVLGDKLAERGETERAINCYQKVIKLNAEYILAYEKLTQLQPSNWENWYVLGEKLETKGETESAIACYQQVISLNPNLCECYIRLAKIFTKQQKKSEAIQVYQQSIEVNCHSADIHCKLGNILLETGDVSQAIESFEESLKLKFDQPELLLKLGVLLKSNNQYEKSLGYCTKAVALFPQNIEIRTLLPDLLMLTGRINEARKCYYDLAKMKLDKERQGGKIGTLFLCVLPKSGTTYIKSSLCNGLNMPPHPLSVYSQGFGVHSTGFLEYTVTLAIWEYYSKSQPEVNVAHLIPNNWNKLLISCITDKLVVNVKDPRQGLLSWIHHIMRARINLNIAPVELFRQYTLAEAGYFDMSYKEQIDYQIENENGYMSYAIKWIDGWLDAQKSPEFYPEILFTKFEDLATNPKTFFEQILDFYEIEKSRFIFPEPPQFKEETRFRKGKTDEWREAFTSEQKEKATKMIPQRLLDKFGWPTE